MVGLDADGMVDVPARSTACIAQRPGSAVTNGARRGVDLVPSRPGLRLARISTASARPLTDRHGYWLIINDVAGFIGPEVFATPEQLERACIEDSVRQAHGLTWARFVRSSTGHRAMRLVVSPPHRRTRRAGLLMAVRGNADPMWDNDTSVRENPPGPGGGRDTGRPMTSAINPFGGTWQLSREGRPQPGPERGRVSMPRRRSRRGLRSRPRSRTKDVTPARNGRARFDLGIVVLCAPMPASMPDTACTRRTLRPARRRRDRDSTSTACTHGRRRRAATRISRGRPQRGAAGRCSTPRRRSTTAGPAGAGVSRMGEATHQRQLRGVLPRSAGAFRRGLASASRRGGAKRRVRAGPRSAGSSLPTSSSIMVGEGARDGPDTMSLHSHAADEAGQLRWSRNLDHAVTTAAAGAGSSEG